MRLLGIRHHSPACAKLVRYWIARERPAVVLIEGPSDFNARIDELRLPHRLPMAIYSFSHGSSGAAQCWFPFAHYSPEWVALKAAHEVGAQVRFMDLPHWSYRTLSEAERRADPLAREQRSRYAIVNDVLCQRLSCDGSDALWDHLFESDRLDSDDDFERLTERLGHYFDELRGDLDENTSAQDAAREAHMRAWLGWALDTFAHDKVLAVCGGWHQPALRAAAPCAAPAVPTREDETAAGAYLVPYEYRQLDALGGYASGVQSPLFYAWLHDIGAQAAADRALRACAERLRERQQTLSTADLIAARSALAGLMRVRGRELPTRHDVLDAVQSTWVKEALSSTSPWHRRDHLRASDHPLLREALLALTGEVVGELAGDTPLPPLVRDIEAVLAAHGIALTTTALPRVLDRRRAEDAPVAQVLWRLLLLGADGIVLKSIAAPGASRALSDALQFEERWMLQRGQRWLPSLIESSVYGASLAAASRARLQERANGATASGVAAALCEAIRAGFYDLGDALADRLQTKAQSLHDLGELAGALQMLLDLANAGFWGIDTLPLLQRSLGLLGNRVLYLLDETELDPNLPSAAGGSLQDAVVAGVRAVGGALSLACIDRQATLAMLARMCRERRPPALVGAALGLCHRHAQETSIDAQALTDTVRAQAHERLGDVLFGLFALARNSFRQSDTLARAVHAAIEAMTHDQFLIALPSLRAAFAFFPPRERGRIAEQIAALLGLTPAERSRLLSRVDVDALLDARRIEAQAHQWARDGVLAWGDGERIRHP